MDLCNVILVQCHVTYGSDVARDLRNLIEADDLSLIIESKHRPRCVIEFISQSLQLLKLDDTKRDLLVAFLNHFAIIYEPFGTNTHVPSLWSLLGIKDATFT